jgi:hypothetical protein
MNGAHGTPLTPDSLAADGNQGANAKAGGHCEAQHTPSELPLRHLALFAVELAQEQLARYAVATDDPEPGIVEAADLLDAAAQCLVGPDFCHAQKGEQRGDA